MNLPELWYFFGGYVVFIIMSSFVLLCPLFLVFKHLPVMASPFLAVHNTSIDWCIWMDASKLIWLCQWLYIDL